MSADQPPAAQRHVRVSLDPLAAVLGHALRVAAFGCSQPRATPRLREEVRRWAT